MNRNRTWLVIATIGFVLVCATLLVVCLTIFAKEQFQWLVGTAFLGTVVITVLVGALALLVATWMLPDRMSWRGWTVTAWCLIALASPLFGIMFLLPWGVLLLMAPLVIYVLIQWYQSLKTTAAGALRT